MTTPCKISPHGRYRSLPGGYTQLAFLAAPYGGVGIDIEYAPIPTSGFMTDFETLTYDKYQHVLSCSAKGSGGENILFTPHYNGDLYDTFAVKVLPDMLWRYDKNSIIVGKRVKAYFNWLGNNQLQCSYSESEIIPPGLKQVENVETWLFMLPWSQSNEFLHGRLYAAAISEGKHIVKKFVPAINECGIACMYDTINQTPHFNGRLGQTVVGINSLPMLKSVLDKLPVDGGMLSLSLPSEANTPETDTLLQNAHSEKGWTFTVHEYRNAATATYRLRRNQPLTWFRKIQKESGQYITDDSTHWEIERCVAIYGPLGNEPGSYGYQTFDNEEQAAEYWQLIRFQPIL